MSHAVPGGSTTTQVHIRPACNVALVNFLQVAPSAAMLAIRDAQTQTDLHRLRVLHARSGFLLQVALLHALRVQQVSSTMTKTRVLLVEPAVWDIILVGRARPVMPAMPDLPIQMGIHPHPVPHVPVAPKLLAWP